MSEFRGIVEQVSNKDVTTKWGVKKAYSLKVSGSWLNVGFKDPRANVGDEITCDAETTPYGLQTKAVAVLSTGGSGGMIPSTSLAPKPAGGSYGGSKVFPIPPLHGDRSIVRQNALARATDLYIAARGSKPFEVDDDVTAIIIHFARKFEGYTTGDLDLAQAKAEMAKATIEA